MFNQRIEDKVYTCSNGNQIIRYQFDTSYFPKLQGSEKQVAWAEKIRNRLLITCKYTLFGRMGGDKFVDKWGNEKSVESIFEGRDVDGLDGDLMTTCCECYAAVMRLSQDLPSHDWLDIVRFLVSIRDAAVWIQCRDLFTDNALVMLVNILESIRFGDLKEHYEHYQQTKKAA